MAKHWNKDGKGGLGDLVYEFEDTKNPGIVLKITHKGLVAVVKFCDGKTRSVDAGFLHDFNVFIGELKKKLHEYNKYKAKLEGRA